MPVSGGDAEHLRIEGLQFRGHSGRIRVTVVDEMDRPTAVRLYVEASDGKGYAPRGEPIFYYPLEPGGMRDAFFVAVGSGRVRCPCWTAETHSGQGIRVQADCKDCRCRIRWQHRSNAQAGALDKLEPKGLVFGGEPLPRQLPWELLPAAGAIAGMGSRPWTSTQRT